MDAGIDRDGRRLRVQMQKFPAESAQVRQLFLKGPRGDPRHVQPGRFLAVFPAEPGRLPGHHVPGHQAAEFRIQFLHIVPGRVAAQKEQPPALASGGLGDQRPFAADGRRGGVVLDHFQIGAGHARSKGRRGRAAGVLHRAGGLAEQAVQPAAAQEHRPQAHAGLPAVAVPEDAAGAGPVFRHYQVQQRVVVPALDHSPALPVPRPLDQGGSHLFSGAGLGKYRAPLFLAAEIALVQLSLRRAVEGHAQLRQFFHDLRGLRRHRPHGVGVRQTAARRHGVFKMLLGAVSLTIGVQGGVDAPLGHDGLGPLGGQGGDQNALPPALGQGDGRAEARQARADDQNRSHAAPPEK